MFKQGLKLTNRRKHLLLCCFYLIVIDRFVAHCGFVYFEMNYLKEGRPKEVLVVIEVLINFGSLFWSAAIILA